MSTSSEPSQRTDISMKPLGPINLNVLYCGFCKTKSEKAISIKKEKKDNSNSTIKATTRIGLNGNDPMTNNNSIK